jgi:hypothetical protein
MKITPSPIGVGVDTAVGYGFIIGEAGLSCRKQGIARYGSVTEGGSDHFGVRGIMNVEYKRRV